MKKQFKGKNLAQFVEATGDEIAEFARKTNLSYSYIHRSVMGKNNSAVRKTTLAIITKAYPKIAEQFFSPDTLDNLRAIKVSKNFNKRKTQNQNSQQNFFQSNNFTVTMSSDAILAELENAMIEFKKQKALIKNLALQLQKAE